MNCFLKGLLAGSSILIVFVALLIASDVAQGGPERKSSRRAKVEELFNQNCARCHGADGHGDTPQGKLLKTPDFTDPDWWKENSRITGTKSLRAVVTRGNAAMPAFGKKLTRGEINALVDRVRKFRK
jgi:mono/diheme cytochrome c family protein